MKTVFSKGSDKFSITAKLSDDKLKLFVDIEPKEKQLILKDDLLQVIKEFAPQAEIHEGVIEDIIKHLSLGEKVSERRIAKGFPAEDGANGKLLLLVKKFSNQAEVAIDEKGFADLTSLHLFDNVLRGQIVGRVYPPRAGKDGRDALANLIPFKPGKPFKPSLDKTVELREPSSADQDFQTLVALEDGYLSDEGGRVSVQTELSIKGDVDFRYGNIDFVGRVVVQGDVMPGFNITARKGIEVKGSIRGGSLTSMEGDIVVKGFVFGGKNSRVISGRSFTANVVQEINAEIAGNITIQKEAIDSNLRTESAVYIPQGQLVGGKCFAVCGVEAKYIGNEANKETDIHICSNIETHTDYARVLANIESHERAKKLIEVHLGPLAHNSARLQLLKSPHREKMQALYNKMLEIDKSRISLLAKKKSMLEEARYNETTQVNYLSKFYEGAAIKAGNIVFKTKETLKGPGSVLFISKEQRFEISALKALECTYNVDDMNSGDKNDKQKKSK